MVKRKKKLTDFPELSNNEKYESNYKVIKTTLKSCLFDSTSWEVSRDIVYKKINDLVIINNEVIIHTYNLLNLYYLHSFNNDLKNNFDNDLLLLIKQCIRIVIGRPINNDLLNQLFKNYIESNLTNKIHRDNFKTYYENIINYNTIDIKKNIENNIIFHFHQHLKYYIKNVMLTRFLNEKSNLDKKQQYKIINSIINDIINIQFTSDQQYHKFIIEHQQKFNMSINIEKEPLKYLYGMFLLNQLRDKLDLKTFCSLPLRTSWIPKSIRIDNQAMLLYFKKELDIKQTDIQKGIVNKRDQWSKLIKLPIRLPKNYDFSYQIITDGFSISLLYEKIIIVQKKKNRKETKTVYNLTEDDWNRIDKKEICGLDPGKSDLFTICKMNGNEEVIHSYSNSKWKNECYIRRRTKIIKDIRKKFELEETNIKGRKSTNFDTFTTWLSQKYQFGIRIKKYYENILMRKLAFRVYVNKQRGTAQMMNELSSKIGKPSDVVIGFGNAKIRETMKYYEPTLGKGLIKLFEKAGYELIFVDEFRTSITCSSCDNFCEKEIMGKRHKSDEPRLIHKLLRCKNVNCKKLWNRDVNASRNMLRCFNRIRPESLKRTKKEIDLIDFLPYLKKLFRESRNLSY